MVIVYTHLHDFIKEKKSSAGIYKIIGQPLDTPNIYFMYTKRVYFDHARQSCWCAQVCTPIKMVYTIAYPNYFGVHYISHQKVPNE
jgi:hypothetical protein